MDIGKRDTAYQADRVCSYYTSDLSSCITYTAHVIHEAPASAIHFFCSICVRSVWFQSGRRLFHITKEYTFRPVSFSGYRPGLIPYTSKSIEAASVATGTGRKMDIRDVIALVEALWA